MKRGPIKKRYDTFYEDAIELLKEAEFDAQDQKSKITGRAFYAACVALLALHFPDDYLYGHGPRGIFWRISPPDYDSDNLAVVRSVVIVMKSIIKNRPPLDIQAKKSPIEGLPLDISPFYEKSRKYQITGNKIFVLMPFREPWSDRIWNEHIFKYLNKGFGNSEIIVTRADEMFGQGVMEDIFEGIATATLVIAECTRRNPNVLYELGIAHSLGKRTALLSQKADDIPFDLQRFRFCIYEDNSTGYPKLEHFLQETMKEVFRK